MQFKQMPYRREAMMKIDLPRTVDVPVSPSCSIAYTWSQYIFILIRQWNLVHHAARIAPIRWRLLVTATCYCEHAYACGQLRMRVRVGTWYWLHRTLDHGEYGCMSWGLSCKVTCSRVACLCAHNVESHTLLYPYACVSPWSRVPYS